MSEVIKYVSQDNLNQFAQEMNTKQKTLFGAKSVSDQLVADLDTIGDALDQAVADIAVLDGRVDNITSLPEGSISTSADAELVDIRVGADGTVYSTAGDAVRSQISNVINIVSDATDNFVYKFTEKKGINTSASANLNLQTDNDTDCIKIECSEGDKFTVSGEGWASLALWAFYGDIVDSTYPRLSFSGTSATANKTVVTAPENSKYFVMNVKRSPQNYAGFCCHGDFLQRRVSELEKPIPYENTAFFERNHSQNLFNIDDYVIGRLKSDGSIDSSADTYFTTHFIDLLNITGNKLVPVMGTYTNVGASGWAAYDANKQFISGSNSSFSSAKDIPFGTRFIRLSYSLSGKYNFAVFVNNTGDGLQTKIYYDNWQINRSNVNLPNWYKNKKASALGDSITENGNMNSTGSHSAWRKFVSNRLMLADEIANCGVGGSKVSGDDVDAMWKDARINSIPNDSDIVFFNGGMNDWAGNVLIGDEDSSDTSTFYGALNTIAEKLMSRTPNALIVWMTTTFGMFPAKYNSIGLSTYDYGRAIKKVAEKHGFLCVDLHALCGWNQYNVSTFVNEETSGEDTVYIHPNENGGKKITTAICSVLESFQPYV